jgi:hypothetical protein
MPVQISTTCAESADDEGRKYRSDVFAYDNVGLAAPKPTQHIQQATGCHGGLLITTTQGYVNLKSYSEFANQNRPGGWNAWGHIRDLAGRADAERPDETNDHEIARPLMSDLGRRPCASPVLPQFYSGQKIKSRGQKHIEKSIS